MNPNDNYSLSIQSLTRFNAKFKPGTSTSMKSVIAALYYAQNDGVLKYTNIIGLLQLDQDRKLKTKCLRLYNIQTMKLAFQVELYYGFIQHYKRYSQGNNQTNLYYFDYPVGMIGFLFRNKQEAQIMYNKIKSQAPTKKDSQQFQQQIKARQKKQQQANSFFGKVKKKIFGQQEVVYQSSQVQSFKKIYNTSIDSQGKLNQEGQSPFPVDIIDRIGLTQKDKKNPELMNMIANDLLIHQLKKQVIQNPQPEILQIIKQHEKQQTEYLQQCRQTKIMNIPPPPPPPPILSPLNRISMAKVNSRANLMQQIRNNNIKLKHVKTNQKGGINIDLSAMDTVDRDDFATALKKKIAMRKRALNKYKDSDEEDDQ